MTYVSDGYDITCLYYSSKKMLYMYNLGRKLSTWEETEPTPTKRRHNRNKNLTYFFYLESDKASMDENGYVKIIGRIKVLLNVFVFLLSSLCGNKRRISLVSSLNMVKYSVSFLSQDMIIRGGENISPAEIEEFLYHHPKIQEAEVLCWGILQPLFRILLFCVQ